MDMQGALRARLLAAVPVTALVGQRVTWMDRPQGSALPAVTLQTISDDRPQHMKGFQDYRATRVQVDVWAASYGSGRAVTEAVIAALAPEAANSSGVNFGRSFVEALRDLSERLGTQDIYRTSFDLIVHHAAA